MSGPLVSVIIPCFKQAQFLPESIASLQAQTHSEWEAIIVDDGSPDETAAVAMRLSTDDPRVRLVRKANGGLSSARNAGIEVAKGRYFQFLDADDLLPPAKLAWQSAYLASNPSVEVVFSNAWYFRDGEPESYIRNPFFGDDLYADWIGNRAADPRPILEKFLSNNQFPVCSPLVSRSVIERVGIFLERLRALEDWEYWTRCASMGVRFDYCNIPGTEPLIRVHGASMMHDGERMRDALFDKRLATLEYIAEPVLRQQIISQLVSTIRHLQTNRRERFSALRSRTKTHEELLAVWIARRFGLGTNLHRLVKPLLRILPWRLTAAALS